MNHGNNFDLTDFLGFDSFKAHSSHKLLNSSESIQTFSSNMEFTKIKIIYVNSKIFMLSQKKNIFKNINTGMVSF